MRFDYNWLCELSKTTKTPGQVAQLLTMHTAEVEGVYKESQQYENIVVGQVLNVEKHPDADRLAVVTVKTVEKEERIIVCGAPNVEKGQKVAVALPGAIMTNGMEIQKRAVRGVVSDGMICAEDELGLGNNHEGILVLEKDAKIGESFGQYRKTQQEKSEEKEDATIEVDILPNRAHDCLSHEGIAREICAIENRKYSNESGSYRDNNKAQELDMTIEIDEEVCNRYMAVEVKNITNGDSPDWMQRRLKQCGIKPISTIVDVTNYIMLKTGQPLHAFDQEKLSGNEEKMTIGVRRAKHDEKIVLLDGSGKVLSEKDVVVVRNDKAIALAGIMGGKETAVSKETKSVILESASFDATTIRASRSNHKMQTDAAYRFERDIDPNLCVKAINQATKLLCEISGGVAGTTKDCYPQQVKEWKIEVSTKKANDLLGTDLSQEEMIVFLGRLEIITQKKDNDMFVCTIPTRRIDLQNAQDVIEEIARLYGYENITPKAPTTALKKQGSDETAWEFIKKVKDVLVRAGASEVYNYSFYSQKDAQNVGLGDSPHCVLENPLSIDYAIMRQTLLPGLLKTIKTNAKTFSQIMICEVGSVYFPKEDQELPEEKKMLAVAVFDQSTRGGESFFVVKGIVEFLCSQLGVDVIVANQEENQKTKIVEKTSHAGSEADILTKNCGLRLGTVMEINPATAKLYGVKNTTAYAEIDLEETRKVVVENHVYEPPLKYPAVQRDISINNEKGISADKIEQCIHQTGGELVYDVSVLDMFEDELVRNITFRIMFASQERTLKNDEVERCMEDIRNGLIEGLSVTIG
ncbi:MAG: phenylalanine--tRNA ligase subunit beta [Candidatus Moranbacteria bacterium]|nr:phenylalanine--tRNA ligase subunit beta [Candidatus Moranbacteria bacterium]